MPSPALADRLAHARCCLLLLTAALPACGGARPNEAPKPDDAASVTAGWAEREGWIAGVVADLGEKLGGCAVGDMDPALPGDEIAVAGVSGRIWLVSVSDGRWQAQLIGQAKGEMIQVAVGDVDPSAPGLEVIAVGMAAGTEDDGGEGAAHLLRRATEGWTMEELHRSPALLHAVTTLDVDGRPGDEIIVAGFARRIVQLSVSDAGWIATELAQVDGAVKSLQPFGAGLAAACADGALVETRPADDGTWRVRVLDQALAGLARLGGDGRRLLVARDDGVLQLVQVSGDSPLANAGPGSGGVDVAEVHRESGKLRGAVIADLDPSLPGLELGTAGYGRCVTVVAQHDGAWLSEIVWQDDDRLHHLAAGHIPAVGESAVLVACGYSGRVVVAIRRPGRRSRGRRTRTGPA
jgi:hypothetical protein